MEFIAENLERRFLEWNKENKNRLEEIKELWKRRKGDYSRLRTRRGHAPTRRRRTPTIDAEEGGYGKPASGSRYLEIPSSQSDLAIQTLEFREKEKPEEEDKGKGREQSFKTVEVRRQQLLHIHRQQLLHIQCCVAIKSHQFFMPIVVQQPTKIPSVIFRGVVDRKPWDPGGSYYVLCTCWSLCFKQWDPGERSFVVSFIYPHLEDKVNFEAGGMLGTA